MAEVLLLTRGNLAQEWLRATRAVCGSVPATMTAVALPYSSCCEDDIAHVQTSVLTCKDRGPLLILTDLHGSTPTNLAAAFADETSVAVVAGANLAMVLRLACEAPADVSLPELVEWICAKGRAAIRQVSLPETQAAGDRAPAGRTREGGDEA